MSTIALTMQDGSQAGLADVVKPVKENINAGRIDRRKMEPTWQSNMAFAAGQYWLRWDRDQRKLVFPADLVGKELYSAPVLDEYRMTALGELSNGDDRPELLLVRDDEASEEYQEQANRALGWGWDHEFEAATALTEARRLCVDITTSAVRCMWDPMQGPTLADDVPHLNGKPLFGEDARTAVAGAAENGSTLKYKRIRQGKCRWIPLSGFNLLVPPGIPHEADFPWECVVRPVPLAAVKAHYGSVASELKEDMDIGSMLGINAAGNQGAMSYADPLSGGTTQSGRVRGHVWLFTYFERPTAKWPDGRVITLAGNQMLPLAFEDKLPYEAPNGERRSGIHYFHWMRVSGRFWSKSLVEVMKDPQRGINKRKTQINEIIDRNMPAVLVPDGSPIQDRTGVPMEFITVENATGPPVVFQAPVPPWLQADIESMREDLEHATGLKGPALGENPPAVNNFAQLNLLTTTERVKRDLIHEEHARAIDELVEDSVYDMRTYWGNTRQIMLAGDDDRVSAETFDATKIPPFFIVRTAKGVKQRSQAAEIQKIYDLWGAANLSGAVQLNPSAWIRWFKDSIEASEPLDLPEMPANIQQQKALLENHRMLNGETVNVAYFDPAQVHIPIHREAQVQAELVNDMQSWNRIEDHVQTHLQAAQQNLQDVTAPAPPPPGGLGAPPGAPPSTPGQAAPTPSLGAAGPPTPVPTGGP